MARIRTIKPGFFASEDVAALPLRARLTWVGLWTQCDDAGRMKDHTRLIKAAVWPLDDGVSEPDIEEDLKVLARQGRINRYAVGGQQYLAIVNWAAHQVINRPTPSRIPAPPFDAISPHGGLTEGSRGEGKGKEGKGRDARAKRDAPPRTCGRHPQGTDNPCRACGRAREAFEVWSAEHAPTPPAYAPAPAEARPRGRFAQAARRGAAAARAATRKETPA